MRDVMNKVDVVNKRKLTEVEEEVLERFMEFQKAMIEKDPEMLNEILDDDYTLTHMSGKTQTKQEYIDEIMDGTLNYYKSTIDDPKITVIGQTRATFNADVTLDAKVYGIKGTWTLHSIQTMEKIDDDWHIRRWDN